MHEAKAEFIINNFSFIVSPASGCIQRNHERKVTNFSMQSEFTALQGALHDVRNLNKRVWKKIESLNYSST